MHQVNKLRSSAQHRKSMLLLSMLLVLFVGFIPAGSNTILLQAGLVSFIFFMALLSNIIVPRGRAVRSPLNWAPMLLASMAVVCFIQLLDMPCEYLKHLAPLSFEYYQQLSLVFSTDCRGAISIEQPKTLFAGLWWAGLSAWAWMLITVTHANSPRLETLGKLLLVLAVLQAGYGLLMQLSGVEFGAYLATKESYRGHATGTLINRNHFAAMMYIATALALPSLIEAEESSQARDSLTRAIHWLTSRKILLRLSVVIFAIAVVNSHSRMGSTALAAGVGIACLVSVILSIFPRFSKGLASTRYLFFLTISVAAIDVLIVSHWFDLDTVVQRIDSTTAEGEVREEILMDVVSSDWPRAAAVLGTGAGSYESVYRRYESLPRLARVDHAHNDWLQFWLEYGAAGAGLLGLGLILLFKRMAKIPRPQAIAMLSLLFMLGLHAAVDFALRIPALGLYVVAVMVCLLSTDAGASRRRKKSKTKHQEQT